MPVFAPGWWIGFEATVGVGAQPTDSAGNRRFHGQVWADNQYGWHLMGKDSPQAWGDLLLLGTDPQVVVQDADERGQASQAVVPGYSYLVTVVDPDRNVNLTAEDTVLVSAEVSGGPSQGTPSAPRSVPSGSTGGWGPQSLDAEVFILKETGKNTSVFRGYVNTRPGAGRQVQGVLEVLPGQDVTFGYLDFANARGERNCVYRLRLPVLGGMTSPAGK